MKNKKNRILMQNPSLLSPLGGLLYIVRRFCAFMTFLGEGPPSWAFACWTKAESSLAEARSLKLGKT